VAGGQAAGVGGGLAREGKCIHVLPVSTYLSSWSSSRRWLSDRCARASGLRAPRWQGYAGAGRGRRRGRRRGAQWGTLGVLGGLGSLGGLEARLGEGAGEGGALGGRESIFKISYTKSRRKVQNLDPWSDLARAHLQIARWVYEGGESREGRQGGGQYGGEVWRLLRESVPCRPGRRPGSDPRPPPEPPPPPTPGPERRTCRPYVGRGTSPERRGALAAPWARPGRWCDRVGRGFWPRVDF
jgi:hypothetical protein